MLLPIFPSHPTCRSCPRWEHVPRNPGTPTTQWGLSSTTAPVLLCIGPAPGFHEHSYNEPFRGKAGRLLRDIILVNLSTLCTIYGTYLTRCGPEPDAKARDYKACFPHHQADLATILTTHTLSPLYILLLGAATTTHFHRLHLNTRISHKSAISNNGRPHQILGRTIPVFATLHPAAVLRNNSLIYTVEDHIELLTATINGQAPTPSSPDIHPVRSPHHLSRH